MVRFNQLELLAQDQLLVNGRGYSITSGYYIKLRSKSRFERTGIGLYLNIFYT